MAKRKSPIARAENRGPVPVDMPKRKPHEKMLDSISDGVYKLRNAMQMADDAISIPELKPHQAAFKKRVKRIVAAMSEPLDKRKS